MEVRDAPGATPLDADSHKELIPKLSTQSELEEFEQLNIGPAMLWAKTSRKLKQISGRVDGIQLPHN